MKRYSELIAAANGEMWAIRPQSLRTMLNAAKTEEHSAKVAKLPKVQGKIAVIPITGMIQQRGSIWEEYYGGTSTMRFEAAFSRAYNEESIGAIVLDVDSPGGTTAGVQMAAERILATRGQGKPVVAVANSMACSAAYWLASAAEYFYAVPGAWSIGSIGVYRMHEDLSKLLEECGVSITFIYEPEFKVEGNPYEPLSDAAKEFQQQQVHHTYDIFNKAVAKHRDTTPANAKESFGKGRDFHADQALAMKMIDKVASLEIIFKELSRGLTSPDITKAESEEVQERICLAWESGTPEELVFRPKTTGETARRRKQLLEKRVAW